MDNRKEVFHHFLFRFKIKFLTSKGGFNASQNEHVLAFRSLPREEAISRLKKDSDQAFAIFEALTPEEWMGSTVPHPYMRPIPTCFYPSFQIIDYGIHTWE